MTKKQKEKFLKERTTTTGYLKLKGRFTGVEVEWKDGVLKCDPKTKREIKECAKRVDETHEPLFIANVSFSYPHPLRYKWSAYALICYAVEDMNIIEGGYPPLGEMKEGVIY